MADLAADCLETVELNHQAAHPDMRLVCCDLSTAEGVQAVLDVVGERVVDLVCGAIPCEQVSQARANRPLKPGELEALQRLLDRCFDIVRKLRPRWWVFEDVEGILPHLPAPMFDGLNYTVRKIQASDYGPQSRVRVFFGVFPDPAQPEPGPRVLGDILRPGPYRTLPQLRQYKRTASKWYGQGGEKRCRVQSPTQASGTVISSQGGMGSNAERSAMIPLVRADQPSSAVTESFRCDEREVVHDPWQRERPTDAHAASRTVAEGSGRGDGLPVRQDDQLVRVMEWQEAALLQGFPPNYVFAASWSRTWKLVAQAIPICVGRAILRAIATEHQTAPRPRRKKR
ncbi:MAG: DNA cytosine methyltransferase [Gemmataceae bacterium]|nr:DNA cytosine methyltransferase [Gemmataceae bacterium]